MRESDDDFDADTPLDTAAAANFTGLAVSTLAKLRCKGGSPAYLKLGRKVVDQHALGTGFTVVATVAYIDTITLFQWDLRASFLTVLAGAVRETERHAQRVSLRLGAARHFV